MIKRIYIDSSVVVGGLTGFAIGDLICGNISGVVLTGGMLMLIAANMALRTTNVLIIKTNE